MKSSTQISQQSPWTLTRIGLIGSAILLIAAIASALYNKNEETAPTATITRTQPELGAQPNMPNSQPVALSPAVMEASFKTIDGGSKKLSDYSGKVLIVDLWATWCGPCRQEIPHLIQMANEYKSKGVEVIGLTNEDPAIATEQVKAFSKQFNINYPIGWADMNMQVGLMNGRNGIPQTLIIGRDGKVKKHFVGFSPVISLPQMKAAINEAIAAG